ncbi:hypothetical protein [Litorivivens sp.]|uniref:hypothetical protein n=1 Tax=Litorivivens sp. TaxID=2020868 RepID=UPI00356176A1
MVRLVLFVSAALCSLSLVAQGMPQAQPHQQVKQLDAVVKLDGQQERDIERMLTDSREKTDKLYGRMQALKMALGGEIGPEFDEDAIREKAKALGELSGELTAETALLQARIQGALTDQQRRKLRQHAQPQ